MSADNDPLVAAPWPTPALDGSSPAAACAWRRVRLARWRTGPLWRLDGWRFPDTWIALPTGCEWTIAAGPRLRVRAGDALVIPAGLRFDAAYGGTARSAVVWAFHADGGGVWGPAVIRQALAGVEPWLAAACHDEALAAHLARRLLLDAALHGLAPAVLSPEPPPLTALRAVIAERLDDPDLDLPAMARAAGCSPVHLRRLCRRHAGRGPHDLLVAARIDAACRLLGDDPVSPVASVARRVGFLSPSRFHAVFRQRIGRSPDAWRRGAQIGIPPQTAALRRR